LDALAVDLATDRTHIPIKSAAPGTVMDLSSPHRPPKSDEPTIASNLFGSWRSTGSAPTPPAEEKLLPQKKQQAPDSIAVTNPLSPQKRNQPPCLTLSNT